MGVTLENAGGDVVSTVTGREYVAEQDEREAAGGDSAASPEGPRMNAAIFVPDRKVWGEPDENGVRHALAIPGEPIPYARAVELGLVAPRTETAAEPPAEAKATAPRKTTKRLLGRRRNGS